MNCLNCNSGLSENEPLTPTIGGYLCELCGSQPTRPLTVFEGLSTVIQRRVDAGWCEHCPVDGACCVCGSVHGVDVLPVRYVADVDDLAAKLSINRPFLRDMGLLGDVDQSWWQDHAADVRAAVCRVGVDLRRGRYL